MSNRLKVMTVVGTRPEIIRLSRVIHALDNSKAIEHIIVHTGQNYDYELNQIFFDDLQIRKPNYFLNAAGTTATETIGKILINIDPLLEEVKPDAFLVLGDTNSCLCAIPAKKRHIPIFHMEAGNRCFDQRVPEETNRKIVDHISDINLTYSDIAREYLLREGLSADKIIKTGSPMFEVLNHYLGSIKKSNILSRLILEKHKYFVLSAHREENINNLNNFKGLISSLNLIAEKYNYPIIASTHPRTRKMIAGEKIKLHKNIQLLKPLGFNDYNALQMNAKAVLSDSGTISEESSILNFPALNIRQAHERPEAMEEASVMMVGLNPERILQGLIELENQQRGESRSFRKVADYSMPNVSDKIVRIIISYVDYINRNVWKKKLNILFISQYFYPENFRGNDIVFDFVAKGHDLTVLTAKPNYPSGNFYNGYKFWGFQNEIIKGAQILRVPIYPRKSGSGLNLFLNYISFIFFSYIAIKFNFKKKYDVIFIQQLSPITMALPGIWIKRNKYNRKTPIFLWVLDLWPESFVSTTGLNFIFLNNLLNKLVKYIYSESDLILISSKNFIISIKEKISIKNKKILFFPNWAETVFEEKVILNHPKIIFPIGFNILFAGNIGEAQGIEVILNAAKICVMDEINFLIMGDGRKLNWLKKYILENQIKNVFLFNRVDIVYMPYVLSKANACLITLKNDNKLNYTVPAKLQAYLASGKIILGSIGGETYDIICGNNIGLASKPEDPISLAKNAIILKNMTFQQREILEENSKILYKERYSKKILFNQLENLFYTNEIK